MDDQVFLVCSAALMNGDGPPTEFRWVVDTTTQRIVSLEACEEAAGDWRAATDAEEGRLLAAVGSGVEFRRRFSARRPPIWAEAPSARRRITAAALEDLRRESQTRAFGLN